MYHAYYMWDVFGSVVSGLEERIQWQIVLYEWCLYEGLRTFGYIVR